MAEPVRIMVAEDEFIIAVGLRTLLQGMGYEVVGMAHDGDQAVALACSLRPDVILMDIAIHGMDGIAATRAIMEQCPTPVIILSAYQDWQRVNDARAAGAAAYLFKPVTEHELQRTIAQVVGPRA